jgi:hypothetical protein
MWIIYTSSLENSKPVISVENFQLSFQKQYSILNCCKCWTNSENYLKNFIKVIFIYLFLKNWTLHAFQFRDIINRLQFRFYVNEFNIGL